MIKIHYKYSKHIHFLNRISFYICSYLENETTEYWLGHSRKRIFKYKKLTIWIRR